MRRIFLSLLSATGLILLLSLLVLSGPTDAYSVVEVTLTSATVNYLPLVAKNWPDERRINWLIEQMTLEEKIAQLYGIDWMETADNTRLGIPGFRMADGPHGVRDGEATCFPVGIAMAATWDPELLERDGQDRQGDR